MSGLGRIRGGDRTQKATPESYETDIPARMDRLPWSRWHWLVILALGVTWLLDGLEVTIVGSLGAILTEPATLGLSDAQVGAAASFYLAGAVLGALVFGYLTDQQGRKRLFFITLGIYFGGVALTAFSVGPGTFDLFRFITGLGIGGEYAAIYSAIDELIPARVRGHADLVISGSYWIGSAFASLVTLYILNSQYISANYGWRLVFGTGAVLAIGILYLRRFIPESPRWLVIHGQQERADSIVSDIEQKVRQQTGDELPSISGKTLTITPRTGTTLREIVSTMFVANRRRSVLGFSLFVSQAFLYNAVFFTYGLILSTYYGVSSAQTPLYLIPFAIGNFFGAVLLGRLFDTIGRIEMISATYLISGVLLTVTGYLFFQNLVSAVLLTLLWSVIFFFASPAASSAYLTVSEIFPLETRAMAVAVFYAIGTATGGVLAPAVFGTLIGTGSRLLMFYGYIFSSVLMILTAIIEWFIGIRAARRPLEEVSSPLSKK